MLQGVFPEWPWMQRWTTSHRAASLLICLACIWGIVGCQQPARTGGVTPEPATLSRSTAIPASETRAPTRAPQPTLAATATVTASQNMVLIWWTPEFFSPRAPAPAGTLLDSYLAGFGAANDGKVQVRPVLKNRYGKGGLLDMLRASQPVAPATLPDIVALDAREVEQAASLGLLQPLEPLLPADMVKSLYPFARQVGQFDGHLLAVQYLADIEHIVYSRAEVSQPPTTWTGLLVTKAPYFFPVSSPKAASESSFVEDIQPSLLSQYLSAGEVFNPETRQLAIKEDALLRLLTFHSQAQSAGVLVPQALNATNLDDSWNAYAQGAALIANVSSHQYLVNQEALPNTSFAAMPGWSGSAPSIARGWTLAVVTTNPARQRAAGQFIAWLLAGERQGRWAQAAGWLPTRAQSWEGWEASPYGRFLQQQLQLAVSHPVGSNYPQTAAQLRKGVLAVIKERLAPAQAVQSALNQPAPK